MKNLRELIEAECRSARLRSALPLWATTRWFLYSGCHLENHLCPVALAAICVAVDFAVETTSRSGMLAGPQVMLLEKDNLSPESTTSDGDFGYVSGASHDGCGCLAKECGYAYNYADSLDSSICYHWVVLAIPVTRWWSRGSVVKRSED